MKTKNTNFTSSINGVLLKSTLVCYFSISSIQSISLASTDSKFGGDFQFRTYKETRGKSDQTNNTVERIRLDLNQTFQFSDTLKGKIEGRYETSNYWYNSNIDDRPYDANWFYLKDSYLDYRSEGVFIRLGNQTVAWGETFGNFYADIVNPKDYRELGTGTLSDLRIPIPMANIQVLGRKSTAQIYFAPHTYHHLLPSNQSNFSTLPSGVLIDHHPYESSSQSESGVRLRHQIGVFDSNIFYRQGSDANPFFTTSFDGTNLILTPTFVPQKTYGFSTTADFENILMRLELVQNPKNIANSSDLLSGESVEYKETMTVLGLDFPQISYFTLGTQASYVYRGREDILSLAKKETRLGVRIQKTFEGGKTFDAQLNYLSEDGSSIFQSSFLFPSSARSTISIDAQIFLGSKESLLGQFADSSRILITLKGSYDE